MWISGVRLLDDAITGTGYQLTRQWQSSTSWYLPSLFDLTCPFFPPVNPSVAAEAAPCLLVSVSGPGRHGSANQLIGAEWWPRFMTAPPSTSTRYHTVWCVIHTSSIITSINRGFGYQISCRPPANEDLCSNGSLYLIIIYISCTTAAVGWQYLMSVLENTTHLHITTPPCSCLAQAEVSVYAIPVRSFLNIFHESAVL